MYEVELKFPVDDTAPVVSQLNELGARPGDEQHQRDRYFGHPARDFAQTDEALRIRSDGEQNVVTYKGPILDPHVKTRHEIEIPFTEGEAARTHFAEMLGLLGFTEVRTVVKRRIPFHLVWEDRDVEVTVDTVEQLGEFIEIETLAPEPERDAARDAVLRLAKKLGLKNSERRSYLCLLLEKDNAC